MASHKVSTDLLGLDLMRKLPSGSINQKRKSSFRRSETLLTRVRGFIGSAPGILVQAAWVRANRRRDCASQHETDHAKILNKYRGFGNYYIIWSIYWRYIRITE